jgi:beta-glucosidase
VTPAFPPGFLWGAATSAHQTEGGNVNSDWWRLEQAGGGRIAEPSGDACDSYRRWPEDMDLLAGAGFTDYRFSVEWARIEPAPGEFDAAEIARYRSMVDGARARRLRPLITLHHFTAPRWFEARGGWSAPDAPELFRTYVEAIAPILATDVEHVCTINEPNMLALFAGLRAGGGASLTDPGVEPHLVVTANLIQAHHGARALLEAEHPHLQVGWSVAGLNPEAEPGSEAAAAAYEHTRQVVFHEAARGDDWVGVQAYTRNRVGTVNGQTVLLPVPDEGERTLNGWEYYPQAVADAVRAASRVVGDVPIIVTENGIATSDDERRIAYTDAALASLRAAMDDGIDVRGYFHWSLLDNYEWGSFDPTFGLVAVDRRTFTRTPKPSLAWLGALRPRAAEASLTDVS